MPSLETAGTIVSTMSTTYTITTTYTNSIGNGIATSTLLLTNTPSSASSSNSNSSSTSDGDTYVYSYATSKIVRTAVAAGVIVLALTALVLFIKISSWIRFHQRLRRHSNLTLSLQSEQRANAYEIAAWADEPNTAPIRGDGIKEKKSRKERRELLKAIRRGGGNAYQVKEWEGVAA
ncbi:uncharacterized protein IL334_003195 [Kwoniella shivajii]|uniref:Uncharacterized protein n=1 Tax=Kwoniella shivajii TaxID=564305 RepID=A0ABZ1CY13_9TREE|nr:hypothetical protein IL334_003195 [Kwoniella shivajii]